MSINEILLAESTPPHEAVNNSNHYRDNSVTKSVNNLFIKQLRLEILRAQRSNSALSIILITPDKQGDDAPGNMFKLIDIARKNIRDTDICGFVDDKTIGLLLPVTDENGAKKICDKLINGSKNLRFSIAISTYPDHIFESLSENGFIRSDAFPFELEGYSVNASRFALSLKRGVDIVGSMIGMLMLMPVMLFTALAIKATSPGPVIFKQIRLGKQGIPFTFYKFRSMHVRADDQIHRDYIHHFINGHRAKINQGDEEKPLYKIKSDPRITKIGRFIRKTSIDELPQLFNVLIGDMSLVGPRPPLAYEAEKYQPWHLRRILEMKPGITGLWQVEGRSTTEWDDAVRLDIRYIRDWSLLFDVKILFRTVNEVLRSSGAL